MSQTQTMAQPGMPEPVALSHPDGFPLHPLEQFSRKRTAPSGAADDEAQTSISQPSIFEDVHLQEWNKPRKNIPRLGFAYLSFFIAGANDAAVGALIPFLEEYYNLNYTTVSIIFLTPFAGYSLAAFTNSRIHMRWGQRGVGLVAPVCHIAAFATMAAHPPFPVLVALFALSGFGNGLTDAAYCAWAGGMRKSNQILGFMHSCYSLGALCAPLLATSMVVHGGLGWYSFYYVLVGLSVLEWVGLTGLFWEKTGALYREEHAQEGEREGGAGSGTKQALKSKITWLSAGFIFLFMAVEVGLGGWVVTFMLRVRNADAFAAGASSSGFWAGMVAGRALLGFVTDKFGERLSVLAYITLSIGLQLLFWLVPQFIVSAVAVSFLGFFLGPLYPASITLAAKLLPKHLHVVCMGFALAIGGAGGSISPFTVGTIAGSTGVWVLQPIMVGLLVVMMGVWFAFPKVQKND